MGWLKETLPAWMFDAEITAMVAVGAGLLGLVLGFAYARFQRSRGDK